MRLIFGLLCLGYAFSAAASSPGVVEGLPGCSWDATVIGGGMISSATDVTFFPSNLIKSMDGAWSMSRRNSAGLSASNCG